MILELLKSLSHVANLGVEVKDLIGAVELVLADVAAIEAGKPVNQSVGVLEIAGKKYSYGVSVALVA